MREQRRLSAIVSADVAGYSRLMGGDESGTLATIKAIRVAVVDSVVAAHGGRIVKTIWSFSGADVQPIIPNGIPLLNIHYAAFDAH